MYVFIRENFLLCTSEPVPWWLPLGCFLTIMVKISTLEVEESGDSRKSFAPLTEELLQLLPIIANNSLSLSLSRKPKLSWTLKLNFQWERHFHFLSFSFTSCAAGIQNQFTVDGLFFWWFGPTSPNGMEVMAPSRTGRCGEGKVRLLET